MDDDGPVDFSSLFVVSKQSKAASKQQKILKPVASGKKHKGAGAPAGKPLSKVSVQQRSQENLKPVKKRKAEVQVAGVKEVAKQPTTKPAQTKRVSRAGDDPAPRKKQRVSGDFWPFEVDYNDHFETSDVAVNDIEPVLLQLCKKLKKAPAQLAIYDPFFCQGGIRRHYEARGFTNFIHRKRDFYQDVSSGNVPTYDILVTNPPYSGDHKERILEHVLRSGKPWALLLPNYVATKAYFGELLADTGTPPLQRPFYLTPHTRYGYDHPEGTGHAESPFFSIWYVGLGPHTEAIYGACRARLDTAVAAASGGAAVAASGGGGKKQQQAPGSGKKQQNQGGAVVGGGGWEVALARSVDALREAGAVPTDRRLNPKQRARLKKQRQGGSGEG